MVERLHTRKRAPPPPPPHQSLSVVALLPFLLLLIALILPRDVALATPLGRRAAPQPPSPSNPPEEAPVADPPVPPSRDPFYRPDASRFRHLAPGEVIAVRNVTVAASLGAGEIKTAASYQVLYRSTSVDGSPQADVATVLVPYGLRRDPLRLVSFQVAYDSACVDCSPSYSLARGTDPGTGLYDPTTIGHLLSKGWALVVPDYEGPDAGFLVGRLSAYGVLDGVRAALRSLAPRDVAPAASLASARLAMYGYSGGAFATLWAAQEMVTRAPELVGSTVGAAVGGIPVQVKPAILKANYGIGSTLQPAALFGLANVYPALANYLDSVLTPAGKELRTVARTNCTLGLATRFAFQDFITRTTVSSDAFFADAAVTAALDQATLGGPQRAAVPSMPLYVFQSTLDDVVDAPLVDAYVADLCSRGARIEYSRETQSSISPHNVVGIVSTYRAYAFLSQRLDADDPATTTTTSTAPRCTTTTRESSLQDPLAQRELTQTEITLLLALVAGLPPGVPRFP